MDALTADLIRRLQSGGNATAHLQAWAEAHASDLPDGILEDGAADDEYANAVHEAEANGKEIPTRDEFDAPAPVKAKHRKAAKKEDA